MNQSLQVFMDSRSRKTVIITSIILLLAGIAGIVLPQIMSLAVAFFAGWPFTTVWLIGLLIGVSLFFDGLSLLMLGLAAGTNRAVNQTR